MKSRDEELKRAALLLYKTLAEQCFDTSSERTRLNAVFARRTIQHVIALYDSLIYDLAQKEKNEKRTTGEKRGTEGTGGTGKKGANGSSNGGWPPDPPEPLLEYIGSMIKTYRKDRKLTQAELADMIHADPATVSRHERGKGIDVCNLEAYAKVFGIDVVDFFPRHGKSIFNLIFTFVQKHHYNYEDTDTFLKYMDMHNKEHRFLPNH